MVQPVSEDAVLFRFLQVEIDIGLGADLEFAAALERWQRDGVPAQPRAWLVSAGRFKAIDQIRRRARFDASLEQLARELESDAEALPEDQPA